MRMFQQARNTSLPILRRAVAGVCLICGAASIAAICSGPRGYLFIPLYAGAVWAWYFIEVKVRTFRTFGSVK